MGAALSSVRVETDSPEYAPGHIVRGTVHAVVEKELDYRAIELEAVGVEAASFEQSDIIERALSQLLYYAALCMNPPTSTSASAALSGPALSYSSRRDILLNRQSLRDSGRLLPGPTSIPFSFQLPYDIPCSATLDEGTYSASIQYRIVATLLHDSLHVDNLTTSCTLTIVAPPPQPSVASAVADSGSLQELLQQRQQEQDDAAAEGQRHSSEGGSRRSGAGDTLSGGTAVGTGVGGVSGSAASPAAAAVVVGPLETGCTEDVTFLAASQGVITLKVHGTSTLVVPGQAVHLDLQVQNHSSVQVLSIVSRLTETIRLVGYEGGDMERGRRVTRTCVRVLAEERAAHVVAAAKVKSPTSGAVVSVGFPPSAKAAGGTSTESEEVKLRCNLSVPSAYGPAIKGELVASTHELEVTLETEKLCSDVTATARVILARAL